MRSKLLQYEEQGSPVRSSELSSQHSKTRLPEQPHARISCSEFHVWLWMALETIRFGWEP